MKRPSKRITDVDRQVGARVRAQRKALGLSQEKLAAALGITFQQVQKYENGGNRISASRLQDIADTFGVPMSFFFGEKNVSLAKSEKEIALLSVFFSTADGLALSRAFMRIGDKRLRRQIRVFVEQIAASY